jgi:NTP pyrophosphatase (non-canonical NTP hydrolase)
MSTLCALKTIARKHTEWPRMHWVTNELVHNEIERGRTKFPGYRFTFAALIEEVGELAEAILGGNKDAVRREAIQVAAISARIAEELDDADYEHSPLVCAMFALGRVAKAVLQRKHDESLVYALLDNAHRLKQGDATFADMTDTEAQP